MKPQHDGSSGRGQSGQGGSGDPGSLAKLASLSENRWSMRIGARLRNYFLTGLIIVGPVTITLYIVWWLINVVDAWVKPLMPDFLAWLRTLLPVGYFPEWVLVFSPLAGVIFATIALTIVGALAANLLGRTIVSYGELVLRRMPVVRGVYTALKQIFETVLSESGSSFQQVGLVEFPRKGMWSIVFVAGEGKGEVDARLSQGEPTICAFLPCTPNPTTGYLIYVPKSEIILLDMKIEDAAKLVISAGLITPDFPGPDATLADGKPVSMAQAARKIAGKDKGQRPPA